MGFQIEIFSSNDKNSQEEILYIVSSHQSAAFSWSTEKMLSQLRLSKTFLARAPDGKVLGFLCCSEIGDAVDVPVLATAPDFRQKGVMESLLRAVIASHYRDQEIWLEVHEHNGAARKLYQKLGFIESGRRPRYYSDGAAAILCTYGAGKADNI